MIVVWKVRLLYNKHPISLLHFYVSMAEEKNARSIRERQRKIDRREWKKKNSTKIIQMYRYLNWSFRHKNVHRHTTANVADLSRVWSSAKGKIIFYRNLCGFIASSWLLSPLACKQRMRQQYLCDLYELTFWNIDYRLQLTNNTFWDAIIIGISPR